MLLAYCASSSLFQHTPSHAASKMQPQPPSPPPVPPPRRPPAPAPAPASTVKVSHNGVVVFLEEAPTSFDDFESWSRARFGLEAAALLKFSNKQSGNELVPSSNIFAKNVEIDIEVLPKKSGAPEKRKSDILNRSDIPKQYDMMIFNEIMIEYGSTFFVILLAISLTPHTGKNFDLLLVSTGFDLNAIKYWKQLFIEAYIGFLCWSTTYLFIRRMLNPENHG